jgi:S-adenosylmethionine-diacylgycerolhomoserine-N-methlytransferase
MIGTAERMDRIYRSQRFIYDFTRRPYLLGRGALIAGLKPAPGARVLEIGCGTAWNLIRAAELYPAVNFYGLDVSPVMLETAQQSIDTRGLGARIVVCQSDATSFDPLMLFGCQSFDRVFISYALSMIPNWLQVVSRAMDATRSEGSVHIVDFGPCDEVPVAFRTLLRAWLGRFSVRPLVEFEREIVQLSRIHGFTADIVQLYRGYAMQAVLTRSR